MREVFIKTPGGHRWPFSKGLLVESMMMAGLKMEPAMSVAHTIEEQLRGRKRPEITAQALKKLLIGEVSKSFGPETAERIRGQTQAFEDIVVKEGYRRRPFSKGVLARSLEDAGFSTREAQALARALESRLRREGIKSLESAELEHRVMAEIEELFGRSARVRYSGRQALSGEIFVEEGEGEPRVPFSKGVLAQSIMGVGLSPDAAYRLARDVERRLREGGSAVVTRDFLRRIVSEELIEEAGEELSRRYYLLRGIRRTTRPVHLLIGGVAGVGKSVLASALGYRLGITRMLSTDAVREILRATIPPDLLPTLHSSSFDSWRALATPKEEAEPDPAIVMQGFRDQVSRVAVGLRAIQERSAQEKTSLIVEGVHVVPGYMSHQHQGDVIQIPMMLILQDEEIHVNRFAIRDRETGGSRGRGSYMQFFREIRLIQEHLQDLARSSGIPIIPAENLDESIEKALEVIVDRLQDAYLEAVQS
ncbi:MAG: 2-phosphoglycerate kinase [Meiothermus sp.]|nr:2-phosphoglycerate kinase [Meiothermus sp.]